MPSKKQRRIQASQKYDLSLVIKNKDDRQRIPQSINGIFDKLKEDSMLSRLLACGELKGNIHLRLRDPDHRSELQEKVPHIIKFFGVDMEPAQPKCLFLLLGSEAFEQFDMPVEEIGNNNAVGVLRLYRKSSLWYLQVASKEDSAKLAKRGTLFLGQDVQPFTVRAITGHYYECNKCSAAGHFRNQCKSETARCGKCAREHETNDCPVTESQNFQCPNCSEEDGRGHASFFAQCQNPRSRAVRADAGLRPVWLDNAIRDLTKGHQQEQLQTMVDASTSLGKKGRPTRAVLEAKKRRRIEGPNTNGNRGTMDSFLSRTPKHSSSVETSSSPQGTNGIDVGSSISTQELPVIESDKKLVGIDSGLEENETSEEESE